MWNFDDPTKPVIGMYGMKNADDERVSQLGWIQLDTVCQDAYDASWEPEDTLGDDIAVQVFEGNVHDGNGIALKSKNVKQEDRFAGY